MGRVVSTSGQISKSESLIRCAEEQEQKIFDTIMELGKFANEPALTGDAYDNAKGYVQTVLVPVNKALFHVLEKEVSANKRVIDSCNTHLGGITLLNEDTISGEIRRLQGLINSLQNNDSSDPMGAFGQNVNRGISLLIDMYYSQIAQLKKQLEKLNAFDAATRNLHSAVYAQMDEAQRNMTATFSAVSFSRGRFHYSDVDLSWAVAAVAAWDSSPRAKELNAEYEFKENLKMQFGFDDETVEIMLEVYKALKKKYQYASEEQLGWRFSRLMGGFVYNDDKIAGVLYKWDETAGIALTDGLFKIDEKQYFMECLGLSEEEYQKLREEVILQHKIAGRNNDTLPEDGDKYAGKADFAHQMITTSAILGERLGMVNLAIFGGLLKGEGIWTTSEVVEYAGWLGDATTTFGPDDYNADLDARNIATYMQEKGLSFMEATNQYYRDLEIGQHMDQKETRATIFLKGTPLTEVQEKIYEDLVMPTLNAQYNDALMREDWEEAQRVSALMNDDAYKMDYLEDHYPDAYNFIKSLEAGASEMITNAP